MREIFYLLGWLAQPLYLILGVFVLWHFYRLMQLQGEYAASYFELERDLLRRRQANSITLVILAVEFAVLLLGVQFRAVPYLEAERSLDEQLISAQDQVIEDIPFQTDTPSANTNGALNLVVGTPLGVSDDGIVLTPTLTPTPVGTIQANAPAPSGCSDDRAFLQVPANGMRVFNPIVVRGSAHAEDFAQVKIEISGPSTNNQFVVLFTQVQPVPELSDFGQFVPANYEEGAYRFRLMVFNTVQLVASCEVTIYITLPPQTATPSVTPQGQ